MMALFGVLSVSVLLGATGAVAEPCGEGCAPTYGTCGGEYRTLKNMQPITCCNPEDTCVKKGDYFAECRPKSEAPLPTGWPESQVVTCESSIVQVEGAPRKNYKQLNTEAAAAPAPAAAFVCDGPYQGGATFTTTCLGGCSVPYSNSPVPALSAESQEECLAMCDPAAGCHCALYNTAAKQCTLKWTPCNSALLNLAPAATGDVALQPCFDYPVKLPDFESASEYGSCKPFKVYPGWMVTPYACTAATSCASNTTEAADFDACAKACQDAGYEACKSLEYQHAAAFGLAASVCTLYNIRLEFLGAHAAVKVLQPSGDKPAATVASYCEPPEDFSLYPTNARPDWGVDWESVCEGQEGVVAVPHQQMGCKTCYFIPADRQVNTTDTDADEAHYKSPSLAACKEDCMANDGCGCAFWRPSDFADYGFCALTTAECPHPDIGAQIDFTRVRTAIHKCGYEAPDDVMDSWPDDTYEGIDWFGVWDDVCQNPGSFTFRESNTYCGPDCVLSGTTTVKVADEAACAQMCKDTEGCTCSYYAVVNKLCTLMSEDGGACSNFDDEPTALAYDYKPATQNEVTVQCDFGDYYTE